MILSVCVCGGGNAHKHTPIDIHQHLLDVYGDETVDASTVRQWVIHFSINSNVWHTSSGSILAKMYNQWWWWWSCTEKKENFNWKFALSTVMELPVSGVISMETTRRQHLLSFHSSIKKKKENADFIYDNWWLHCIQMKLNR